MANNPRSAPLRGANVPAPRSQSPYQQPSYGDQSGYGHYSGTGAYGYEEYGSNPYGDHQYSDDTSLRAQGEGQSSRYADSNQGYGGLNGYYNHSERDRYGPNLHDQSSYATSSHGERQSADAYDGIVDDYDNGRNPYGHDPMKSDGEPHRNGSTSFESVRQQGSTQRPGIATRLGGGLAPQSHTTPSTPLERSFYQKSEQALNESDGLGSQYDRLAPDNRGQRPGTSPGTQTTGESRTATDAFDFSSKHPSRGDTTGQTAHRPPVRRGISDNRYDMQHSHQEQPSSDRYNHANTALEDEEEMPNFQNTQEQYDVPTGGPSPSSGFTPYRPAEPLNDRLQRSNSQPGYSESAQSYHPSNEGPAGGPQSRDQDSFERNGYGGYSKSLSRDNPPHGMNSRSMQARERPLQQSQPPRRPRPPEGPSRSRTVDDYHSGRDPRRPAGQGYRQGPPPNGMQGPPRGPMDSQRRPPRPDGPLRGPPSQTRPNDRPDRNQRQMPMRENQPGRFDPSRSGPEDGRIDRSGRGGMSEPSSGGYSNRPKTAGEARDRSMPGKDGARPGLQGRNSDGEKSRSPPAPVRPGLTQTIEAGRQPTRPPPVRHYNKESPNGIASGKGEKRKSAPITLPELNQLQDMARSKPSDQPLQLKLAKKLAEAAVILVEESSSTDPRTRDSNRDRYNQDALKILRRLVTENNANAMFYLAECYGEGALGLAADSREAFNLYQSAAKLNNPAAAYRTAVCCEIGPEDGGGTRQDFQKAVQWYRRAASLGDVGGNYKMGIILLDGLLGQQRSVGEAVTHLKRAAEHADDEHPHALYELGRLHESREYTGILPFDEKIALQEFTQAAKFGHRNSQFKLGKAYEYGLLTCSIDARNSIYWYTKAASQGQHESELALSGWYLTGSDGILDQSDTEAYLWARKAALAEPPLPKAMFAMGYFTEVGIGCPRSLDEAKRWYGRAASQNFQKARDRLEELSRGGPTVQRGRERLSRSNPKQNENCAMM